MKSNPVSSPFVRPAPARRWTTAIVLIGLLVGACAGTPVTQAPAEPAQVAVGDPDTLLFRVETALQGKRFREAAELYAQAAFLTEDERVIEQAAEVAYTHHQTQLVAKIAAHWLTINPTNEKAIRYAAFSALEQYQIDAAVEQFDALLNSAYINPAAGFLGLEPQLNGNGAAPAVTAVFRRLSEMYPQVAEGHYAVAQSALRAEHLELALTSAERARQLSPYWSPAGLLLARIYLVLGRTDEGLKLAREVVERDNQIGNRIEHALLLLAAANDDAGRQTLEELAAADNETALVAERILAIDDFEAGRFEAAAARFNKLTASGAFVYESRFFLGGMAEQMQSWEEARRNYSLVVQGNYAVTAQTRLARILFEHSSLDAALSWLSRFADERPAYAVEMLVARAQLLEAGGDRKGSEMLLMQGLEMYPDAHLLRMQLSFLYERADDVDAALGQLRALQASRPGDPLVQNALGYLLVDRTRRSREGLELVQAALEQTPDSGAVLDSMGWALHRVGRSAEALPYLERARTRIYDPEIELHIGDVYWALGRRDEALATWEEGRKRNPDETQFGERLRRYTR